MTALSTLQKTSRAALVAIALAGTTAVSMMPVQAASRPSIEFNFSIDTHGREFRQQLQRPHRRSRPPPAGLMA